MRAASGEVASGQKRSRHNTNKGRKLTPEILTPDEVARLFDAASNESRRLDGDPIRKARNGAMLALMYYARVKIGALLRLRVGDYNPETGTLNVPAGEKLAGYDIRLDPISKRMVDEWLTRRAELRLRATAPLFVVLRGKSLGNPVPGPDVRRWLDHVRGHAQIQKRVSPEGLRASRTAHQQNETGRFEGMIIEYISAPGFRRRYPEPYQKWLDAHQLLETAADRHATTIGHLCREAIIEFSDQLAHENKVGPFDPKKTKQKVRAVFSKRGDVSGTLRCSLEALLDYWESLVDLASRQEHSRTLTSDDSRALVFQTMLVMREIDLALTR